MTKLNFRYGTKHFIRTEIFDKLLGCRKNSNSFAFDCGQATISATSDNAYELSRARTFLDQKWANLTKTQQSDDEITCILIKEIEGE